MALNQTLTALFVASLLWPSAPAQASRISNSGPRVGALVLVGAAAEKAEDYDMSPLMTAFGWQMETEFLSGLGTLKGNSSLVLLLAGADQGRVAPSATWLMGLRDNEGAEFGLGPNISAAGSGFTLALGRTRRIGELNVPFNITGTFSRDSFRFGVLTGFNTRDTPQVSAPQTRTSSPIQPYRP